MIYTIYRKAKEEDAGQIIAIVAQKEKSAIIDEIELYIFKNGEPIELYYYAGDGMKIPGEGRPIWAEVTWPPSKKWEEVAATDELSIWAKEFKSGEASTVGNLKKYFQ
jgi:hypothetical protein